ncbi:nucleolar 9-like [Octopus vulgaris]|uniref:Nucleolar 9-like n=1 Tax=Octopus vulgaris TaxID=6645 RepID=A0AA36FSB2_OCTVU|nr:nucleolar 9-like [Octopus vulgaris]
MNPKHRMKDQKPSNKSKKGSLSEDTMSYYKRAYQNFKQETCQDPENKSIFLLNVLRQLKTEVVPVCQNQTASHYVETFLKNAEPKHLFYMWQMICSNRMEFCTDRCTSHIMHKTLLLLPSTFDADPAELHDEEEIKGNAEDNVVSDDDDDDGDGGKRKCKKKAGSKKGSASARESFLQFCEFLDDNIETFITDVYASHIVRVSLHILANKPVKDTTTTKGQKFQKDAKDFQLKIANEDENFIKWFFKISKHICALENIYSYFTHKLANPVIQVLVQLTMELDQDIGRKFCSRIIKLCGFLDIPPVDPDTALIDSSRLPDLMMNPVASYLAEELLRSCSNSAYLTWYECSFKDRLIAYAVNGVSSYVLHLVIDRCVNKGMLKVIYAELEPYIEDILALNHMGIIKSLANICQKFGCKQKKFVNSLLNAFHCSEEEKRKDFVLLLLAMKTYDIYFDSDGAGTNTVSETADNILSGSQHSSLSHPIDIHGSMLVQTLLTFSNPQIIVSSFLKLSAEILLDLACDFQGQHIMKQFFESASVSDKDKDDLLNMFYPMLLRMACSKFGSRTCQSMWPNFNIDQRVRVAGILAKQSLHLRQHWYGAFVFHNFQLQLFMNSNKRWRMSQSSKAKKRKIFADILDKNKAVTVSNEDKEEEEMKQCDEEPSIGKGQPKSKKLKSSNSGK